MMPATGFLIVVLLPVILVVGLATAALAWISYTLWRKAVRGAIVDAVSLSRGASNVGICEIVADSGLYDYDALFAQSQRLVIALNDGRTWLSVHRDRLRRRVQDTSKETTIFLIDPNSEMVGVLARKGSTTKNAIQARIAESVQLLSELVVPGAQLEVLGHSLFNPHAAVVGDNRALLTPYFASRGGRTVPVFCFEDSGPQSFFRQLRDDLEALRTDARELRLQLGEPAKLHTV